MRRNVLSCSGSFRRGASSDRHESRRRFFALGSIEEGSPPQLRFRSVRLAISQRRKPSRPESWRIRRPRSAVLPQRGHGLDPGSERTGSDFPALLSTPRSSSSDLHATVQSPADEPRSCAGGRLVDPDDHAVDHGIFKVTVAHQWLKQAVEIPSTAYLRNDQNWRSSISRWTAGLAIVWCPTAPHRVSMSRGWITIRTMTTIGGGLLQPTAVPPQTMR